MVEYLRVYILIFEVGVLIQFITSSMLLVKYVRLKSVFLLSNWLSGLI